MNSFQLKSILAAASIGLAFGLIPSTSNAGGFSHYGQNVLVSGAKGDEKLDELGRNIKMIDDFAGQISWRYGLESKLRKSSDDSKLLLERIKKHRELTDKMVKASKDEDVVSFERSLKDVVENLDQVDSLRKKVEISDSVSDLISQSVLVAKNARNQAKQISPK